jgi:hypothetical protein
VPQLREKKLLPFCLPRLLWSQWHLMLNESNAEMMKRWPHPGPWKR